MAENDLLIKINADAKNAVKAFEDIKDKTEDLESGLTTVAKFSGLAFAALTAEIGLASHAYEDSELASRKLTLSLQNQGVFSTALANSYKERSAALQTLTGFDDDAITKGQALLQGFVGQKQVTDELTKAALDLAAAQGGDVVGGFQSIGRAINGNLRELKAYGIVIDDGLSKSERMAQVTERVAQVLGGQAEAANKGLGSIRGLRSAFSDLQEEIGSRFAPTIETGIKLATKFFQTVKDNPALIDLAAGLIGAGVAITALIAGLTALAPVLITATALATAFSVSVGAVAAPLVVLALGLAAVGTAAGVYVAGTHKAKTATEELDEEIKKATERVEALERAKNLSTGRFLPQSTGAEVDAAKAKLDELIEKRQELGEADIKRGNTEQDPGQAEAAKKRQALEDAKDARERAAKTAHQEALRAENENQSAALIELKQREAAILQQMASEDNVKTLEQLQVKYDETKALEAEQREQDNARKLEFEAEDLAAEEELRQLKLDSNRLFREQDRAELEAKLLSDKETERKVAKDILTERITSRNKEKEDKIKYGETAAALNKLFNSNEVNAAKELSGQLISMQNSRNGILRTIGKAAAVTNIIINTAQGAVAAFTRSIEAFGPIVGPIVGGVLAGAVVAFGAENLSAVASAAEGGLVSGGIPGKDSVPIMAMPGELIVPAPLVPSFLDVAADPRRAQGNADLVPLLTSIDAKLSQPSQTIIQGDVMADPAFIDVLISKINERLQFGNARFVSEAGVF